MILELIIAKVLIQEIIIPKISAILLIAKLSNKLAVFLIFI